jgi:hypothetical protein
MALLIRDLNCGIERRRTMVNRTTPDPDTLSEHVKRTLANDGTNDVEKDTSDEEDLDERALAGEEADVRIGGDISPDRIVGADEAGLGGGLDQAEEARLGITDEELQEMTRRAPK